MSNKIQELKKKWKINNVLASLEKTSTELICDDTFENRNRMLKHCYDDEHCKLYGDCCRNSKYYDRHEQTVTSAGGRGVYNNSRYGCVEMEALDLMTLMIDKCPRTKGGKTVSADDETRVKCENGGGHDFVSVFPVTATSTGHLYKNVYCAWCHGERRGVLYWKPSFQCYGDGGKVEVHVRLEDASDRTLLYRDGHWYYADYANRKLLTCIIQLQQPDSDAASVPPLRSCVRTVGGLVDGCPAGTPSALARACAAYTYVLYEHQADRTLAFRNVDCAKCNDKTVDQLTCLPPMPMLLVPISFSSLFAVDVADRRRDDCGPDELYDITAAKCRNVIRDELSCACQTSVAFEPGEYDSRSLDNGTAYVYAYKRRVRYLPTAATDGSLVVCTEDGNGPLRLYTPPAFASYISYAGVVGSTVSAAALVAHLTLFSTGSEPKNLPEKNLASLSLSLLLGYVSYLSIALRAVRTGSNWPCLVSALAMQFGFLAAFAWMFIMSADVWIVLYASTKKLRVAGGKRNGRFTVYSAFAWLSSATLTVFAALSQLSAVPAFPELRPHFQHDCWFRNPQSLVALFVLPAGITIVANYVSFFGAVRLIRTSGDNFNSANKNSSAVNRSRKNLKIYAKLSLMMGLAWVFGLVGAIADSYIVWTLFTVLNSLQGAFIFFAFDCNWNAVRALAVFRVKHQSVSDNQTTAVTPLSGSN